MININFVIYPKSCRFPLLFNDLIVDPLAMENDRTGAVVKAGNSSPPTRGRILEWILNIYQVKSNVKITEIP